LFAVLSGKEDLPVFQYQCRIRKIFSLLFFGMIILTSIYSEVYASSTKGDKFLIKIDIMENIRRLLEEEDTDNDKKITIEDRFLKNNRGDKKFFVLDVNSQHYEIVGTYYLSNLLQELKLQQEDNVKVGNLSTNRIFENPVDRISRFIREIYWNGLTRRIDEKGLIKILSDTKTETKDGFRYIYVPHIDKLAFEYYTNVGSRHPESKIKVVRLPEVITPDFVKNLDGYHGILALALSDDHDGGVSGVPFVVPGGRFNEMYGWDSYFEALGLLEDGRIDLAQAMVENFVYEINHYGKILNANRTYYLTRSQPPFLTSMALAVYRHLPHSAENREWLKNTFLAAIKEYHNVWMGERRLTQTGLSRYYGEGLGQPPEVEPGHFDYLYAEYAKKLGMDVKQLEKSYKSGELTVPELDEFFTHDRSMRESGHDKTYRWGDHCADFVNVDLNSLLYKYEIDIADTIRKVFNDALKIGKGKIEVSSVWYQRASKRKDLMNKYQWNQERGLFFDYNFVNKSQKIFISSVALYPLWAGLATDEQAKSIVERAIPAIEMAGGLVGSTEKSRGDISESRPERQWDFPNGWAPHQIMAWQGLLNYGYNDIAYRLIYRWLYTITRNAVDYNGTVPEKFDVVNRTHLVFAEYGNVGTKFAYITKEGFGWMNASYQIGLEYLPQDLREKLENLIPPEWIFKVTQ
jgi:alpha,alpha-trehalase